MAAVVKALGSKIRVFKWEISPPQGEEEEESSASALEFLGGIFLIRLSTIFPAQSDEGINHDYEIFFPKTSLRHLQYFETARKLIGAALKQLPHVDSCQNLAGLAGSLAADLLFKFNFGPGILSGQGPVPVIFLRIAVKLQEDPKLTLSPAGKKFPGNVYELIYVGCDFRAKQIRRMCKELCYGGRNGEDDKEPPAGFEEVKADLKIKYFDDGMIAGGDDDGAEGKGNQCPICFETFSKGAMVVETGCLYRFHKRCMYEWLLSSSSCPICGSNCIVIV